MPNCRTCLRWLFNDYSDICDHCSNNKPDVGRDGFTDSKYGRHVYTEAERAKYEREYTDRDDRTEDDI